MNDLPEHARENRTYWNDRAHEWVERGEHAWASEPYWGCWRISGAELTLLPDDMRGLDAIELGCGTGYVSAWMARRGARVTGIDVSEEQLATARRLSTEHGVELELLHGSAEAVPKPDCSFDFAISEYGAAIWCDPHVWIPEAYRLLRPGGMLVFLGNHHLAMVCTPDDGSRVTDRLARPWFGAHRYDWRNVDVDPGGIEFSLSPSAWLRLFREVGFELLDYLELQAPEGPEETRFFADRAWARRFPTEHVYSVRKAL